MSTNFVLPLVQTSASEQAFIDNTVIVGDPSDAERISTNHVKKQPNFTTTVRDSPGRLSALSVLHGKSSFYDAFVWARSALNCAFRRAFRPGQFFDSVISTTDVDHWKKQRAHLVEAFLPRSSLTKVRSPNISTITRTAHIEALIMRGAGYDSLLAREDLPDLARPRPRLRPAPRRPRRRGRRPRRPDARVLPCAPPRQPRVGIQRQTCGGAVGGCPEAGRGAQCTRRRRSCRWRCSGCRRSTWRAPTPRSAPPSPAPTPMRVTPRPWWVGSHLLHHLYQY